MRKAAKRAASVLFVIFLVFTSCQPSQEFTSSDPVPSSSQQSPQREEPSFTPPAVPEQPDFGKNNYASRKILGQDAAFYYLREHARFSDLYPDAKVTAGVIPYNKEKQDNMLPELIEGDNFFLSILKKYDGGFMPVDSEFGIYSLATGECRTLMTLEEDR